MKAGPAWLTTLIVCRVEPVYGSGEQIHVSAIFAILCVSYRSTYLDI